jgi:hypothetical protein
MAEELLSAEVVIKTNNAQAIAGINQVGATAKKVVPEVETSSRKIKEALEGIKGDYGKRSGLGELVETLRGAGAVAGIALVAEVLNKTSEKAAELSMQFRQGKIDAKGLAVGIAESLPIIGSLVQTGFNIREIFTGEKAAIEAANEELSRHNALIEMSNKLLEANQDMKTKAEGNMYAAGFRLMEDIAQPGIQREVQAKTDQINSQENQLRLEMSPMMNERRTIDAHNAINAEEVKAINDKQTQGEKDQIREEYKEKIKQVDEASQKYNDELAQRNKETIRMLDEANDLEIAEIQSGAQEIYKINLETANKLADTPLSKLENFRSEKEHDGYSGQGLADLQDAKRLQMKTEAAVGTRDALRDLDNQYRSTAATTFAEKLEANKALLEEQARTGEISADSIDQLNAAFAKLEHVQIDNKLKDAAIAVEDIGKTDLERQISALERLDMKYKEAYAYAKLMKEAMTGNEVDRINKQAGLVGMNPLDKARAEANQKGLNGNAVGAATGKLLGAELTESMKNPMQKFGDTLDYYKELLRAGDISNQTFQKLQSEAYQGLINMTSHGSIESTARDSIARQFAGVGLIGQFKQNGINMPAANQLNNQKDKNDAKKKADKESADNKKTITDNTDAIKKLNDNVVLLTTTFQNGVIALYA